MSDPPSERIASGPRALIADQRDWWRRLTVSVFLLACSGVTSLLATRIINAEFADRPTPRDLILGLLPRVNAAEYVADAVVLIAILVAALYFARYRPTELPSVIAMLATMYLLRSALILLTPLAIPHGPGRFGFLPPQSGMWPSGHSANVMICLLSVEGRTAPRVKRLLLALAIVEWSSMLLAHGHYSIDVVGGVLLAYFIWREWTVGRLFDPVKRHVAYSA